MNLQGRTIGVFVAEGFEDLEFWVPVMRLREEGARVLVIGSSRDTVTGKHCLTATPETVAREVRSEELAGLVIPGGWAPDKLRRDGDVLRIVRGMRVTGSRGIKDDMENAGATWADEPAFRSGNVVWGRVVEDIPDFCRVLVATFSDEAEHGR